jgi:hypothetical protein
MSHEHKHAGHEHHHNESPGKRPVHHSPIFWVAVVLMLAAIGWYVMSFDLALGPGGKGQPVPAAAP